MRVFFYRSSVGCPACVSYTNGSWKLVEIAPGVNIIQPPTILLDRQRSIIDCNFAYRVVSTVLQPFQRSMDQRRGLFVIMQDTTENSTQGRKKWMSTLALRVLEPSDYSSPRT